MVKSVLRFVFGDRSDQCAVQDRVDTRCDRRNKINERLMKVLAKSEFFEIDFHEELRDIQPHGTA